MKHYENGLNLIGFSFLPRNLILWDRSNRMVRFIRKKKLLGILKPELELRHILFYLFLIFYLNPIFLLN